MRNVSEHARQVGPQAITSPQPQARFGLKPRRSGQLGALLAVATRPGTSTVCPVCVKALRQKLQIAPSRRLPTLITSLAAVRAMALSLYPLPRTVIDMITAVPSMAGRARKRSRWRQKYSLNQRVNPGCPASGLVNPAPLTAPRQAALRQSVLDRLHRPCGHARCCRHRQHAGAGVIGSGVRVMQRSVIRPLPHPMWCQMIAGRPAPPRSAGVKVATDCFAHWCPSPPPIVAACAPNATGRPPLGKEVAKCAARSFRHDEGGVRLRPVSAAAIAHLPQSVRDRVRAHPQGVTGLIRRHCILGARKGCKQIAVS